MTNIIRLNESNNTYASKPVITALGEPEVAIRPSIYAAGLGANATVTVSQLLIDGNYGQINPSPFLGVGTGSLTLKSDTNGTYLTMNQVGIRTGLVIDTKQDKGTLAIIKARVNDILVDNARLMSIGSVTQGLSGFAILTALTPTKKLTVSSVPMGMDANIHTFAVYTRPGQTVIFIDGNQTVASGSATPINEKTGVGINTRSFADTAPNNIDLYNFELYVDTVLTDQQILDYLKTL